MQPMLTQACNNYENLLGSKNQRLLSNFSVTLMQLHHQQMPSDAQARGPASAVMVATMVAGKAVTSFKAVEYT